MICQRTLWFISIYRSCSSIIIAHLILKDIDWNIKSWLFLNFNLVIEIESCLVNQLWISDNCYVLELFVCLTREYVKAMFFSVFCSLCWKNLFDSSLEHMCLDCLELFATVIDFRLLFNAFLVYKNFLYFFRIQLLLLQE